MDVKKLIERVTSILTTPATEWPKVAEERTTLGDLYRNYIVILVAVPVLAGFIKSSVFGIHIPLMGTVRVGVGAGLKAMIASYLLTLGVVYLMSLLVNGLAPTFGGQKDSMQAMKTVAYAYTASWVAGIGQLLPWIGFVVTMAGLIYSMYLLKLGLPHTMKCPPEKATAYTAITLVVAVLAGWLIAGVTGHVAGMGSMLQGKGISGGEENDSLHYDKDSVLGKLALIGKRAEEASAKLDAAQKSGDQEGQARAMREMAGAVLGGGAVVESLAPERMKTFLPATLAGMTRSDYSAERNSAMGVQISTAQATYADAAAGRSLHVEITDMGSSKGLMALAGWAGMQQDSESDHGYEKTYRSDGRMVHEQWDSNDKQGEYSVVLGERFVVKVSGKADSMKTLKSALDGLDLAGLEALRNEGVKSD